jgi:hypothetical protein
MPGPTALFAFTPLPWCLLFYLVDYRYDPGRILHPLRDSDSAAKRYDACVHLGLYPKSMKRPRGNVHVCSIMVGVLGAFAISIAWIAMPTGAFYVPVACQLVAAAVLLALVETFWLGRPPSPPFRERISLSVRTRYLSGMDCEEPARALDPSSRGGGAR